MERAVKQVFNCLQTLHFVLLSFTVRIVTLLDKKSVTLLDVGCGQGFHASLIRRRRRSLFMVGVDLFLPNLKKCKDREIYDDYVRSDARFLPFRGNSFEICLSLEVIEHLKKSQGTNLIDELERVSRNQIIVSTPLGFFSQGELYGNPLEVHKSGWEPSDFEKRGYVVRRVGSKFLVGEAGFVNRKPQSLPSKFISFCNPFIHFFYTLFPLGSYLIICVKKKNK